MLKTREICHDAERLVRTDLDCLYTYIFYYDVIISPIIASMSSSCCIVLNAKYCSLQEDLSSSV